MSVAFQVLRRVPVRAPIRPALTNGKLASELMESDDVLLFLLGRGKAGDTGRLKA